MPCMINISNHAGCFLPSEFPLAARLGFEFFCETEQLGF
jgi:hypothetical protein